MRKFISEFLGTFAVVFCGCGSMLAANFLLTYMGMPIPLGFSNAMVAVAFGSVTAATYYLFKEVSGAHLNPAVSTAVLINGGFEKKSAFIGYIIAQFVGATFAAMLLWVITAQRTFLGQTGYNDQSALYVGIIPTVVVELVLTIIFVMIFLKVDEKENAVAGSAVLGIAITAFYMMALPFTGASLNPARSFGPAIFVLGDTIKQLPVFIVVPVVGAIIAALLYRFVIKERTEEVKETEEIVLEEVEEAASIEIEA